MQKVMLDLGWEGDVDEMWTDFVKQCKSAATGVPYEVVDASCTEIDKDEVLALYSSPTYSTELYCARAAEEIIGLLKALFDVQSRPSFSFFHRHVRSKQRHLLLRACGALESIYPSIHLSICIYLSPPLQVIESLAPKPIDHTLTCKGRCALARFAR